MELQKMEFLYVNDERMGLKAVNELENIDFLIYI